MGLPGGSEREGPGPILHTGVGVGGVSEGDTARPGQGDSKLELETKVCNGPVLRATDQTPARLTGSPSPHTPHPLKHMPTRATF